MIVEDYIARLQELAKAHPGARMMASDYGNDYTEGGDFDVHPEWSERDQHIDADCADADS